jgi:hypothetical protein
MSESLLSNQLRQRLEPRLPKNKKRRNVQYAGRKRADARKVMTGIIFVLQDRRAVEKPSRDERFPFGSYLSSPTPRMG